VRGDRVGEFGLRIVRVRHCPVHFILALQKTRSLNLYKMCIANVAGIKRRVSVSVVYGTISFPVLRPRHWASKLEGDGGEYKENEYRKRNK